LLEQTTRAETALIRLLQRQYFPADLAEAKQFAQLALFIGDNGIVRCHSRLAKSEFDWCTVCPILLPRDSPLTRVLIWTIHVQNHHIGVSHTLAKFRERFWVQKARSLVKSVIHHCFTCRKFFTGPYQHPPMPPLPPIRLAPAIPFLHTGIDLAGPLYIYSEDKISTKAIYVYLSV